MGTHLFNDTDITAIANAIRQKDGSQTTMTVGQMPTRIQNIPTGGTDYIADKLSNVPINYTIPSSITSLPNYAFAYFSSLSSVTIPSTVTNIGSYAFYYCSSLSSVNIPSGVTTIQERTFDHSGLTSITVPSSVTSLGNYAFSACNSLTTVTLPTTMTSIGNYCFYSSNYLTSITFPQTMTTIGNQCFGNCERLGSIVLPQTMTTLGESAFRSCGSIVSVTFPTALTSGTTSIFNGMNTFYYCYRLKTLVNFDTSVLGTNIPNWCFGYTALEGDIYVGNQFKVGMYGFDNSSSAGILYIHLGQTDATQLSTSYTFSSNAFNTSHCRLVVPVGTLSAYQSAFPTWSSIMIEESQ